MGSNIEDHDPTVGAILADWGLRGAAATRANRSNAERREAHRRAVARDKIAKSGGVKRLIDDGKVSKPPYGCI